MLMTILYVLYDASGVADMSERYLKPKEVREMLGISRQTLWEWTKKGIIKAVRLPTGRFRYPESEVKRILEEMKKWKP